VKKGEFKQKETHMLYYKINFKKDLSKLQKYNRQNKEFIILALYFFISPQNKL